MDSLYQELNGNPLDVVIIVLKSNQNRLDFSTKIALNYLKILVKELNHQRIWLFITYPELFRKNKAKIEDFIGGKLKGFEGEGIKIPRENVILFDLDYG